MFKESGGKKWVEETSSSASCSLRAGSARAGSVLLPPSAVLRCAAGKCVLLPSNIVFLKGQRETAPGKVQQTAVSRTAVEFREDTAKVNCFRENTVPSAKEKLSSGVC